MLKTVIISAIAAALCLTALFAGAASATGYLRRAVAVNNVPSTPLATEVAGDCVVQTRWVKSAGQMVQIERPVCY